MHLTDFDPPTFLRDHWQKTPLLIRNPWDAWRNPVEPDELAGLACEPHVGSRLVTGDGAEGGALALEHGPMPTDRFDALGTAPWALLVQAVDHYVPAVADLIEAFRFIPNWRIDDVMVSYATDKGGVGAHYDQYDVFLIQGLGRRRWELGGMCDGDTPLLPHDDLRLLAAFEARQDYVLEPGDILYVPPGIAHRGTAIGHDCMTYSVGFRAPSAVELVEGWSDAVLDTMIDDDADRYGDSGLVIQANPGEISGEALSRLHGMVAAKLADRDAFARWFGTYATAPKNDTIDWRPDTAISAEEVAAALEGGTALVRNPASRFAFVRQPDDSVLLSVDGEATACCGAAATFAEALCASPRIEVNRDDITHQPVQSLVRDLVNRGCIAFEE
ncbi:MAG: cupin domain-containing protein [Parerythrobacter sp.]